MSEEGDVRFDDYLGSLRLLLFDRTPFDQETSHNCRASQCNSKVPSTSQALIDATQYLVPPMHGDPILDIAKSVLFNIRRYQTWYDILQN